MERIRRTEVDSTDEVTKVINRIIDNQNLIQGKLLQLIADVKPKKKPKNKGMVSMKALLTIFVVVLSIFIYSLQAEPEQLTFSTISNTIGLERFLRDPVFPGDMELTGTTTYNTSATPIIMEGTTSDAFEVTIAVTDPTADTTWTYPNAATDIFAFMGSTLVTNAPEIVNSVWGASNGVAFEGSTANDFETTISPTDSTADQVITLPDDSGEIAYTPTGGTTASGVTAIPLTHVYVAYTSTGASQAVTLADGKPGQILTINHVNDGGEGIIQPTTTAGWTKVDFDDAGDQISLIWVDTEGWAILGYSGAAAPPIIMP